MKNLLIALAILLSAPTSTSEQTLSDAEIAQFAIALKDGRATTEFTKQISQISGDFTPPTSQEETSPATTESFPYFRSMLRYAKSFIWEEEAPITWTTRYLDNYESFLAEIRDPEILMNTEYTLTSEIVILEGSSSCYSKKTKQYYKSSFYDTETGALDNEQIKDFIERRTSWKNTETGEIQLCTKFEMTVRQPSR